MAFEDAQSASAKHSKQSPETESHFLVEKPHGKNHWLVQAVSCVQWPSRHAHSTAHEYEAPGLSSHPQSLLLVQLLAETAGGEHATHP